MKKMYLALAGLLSFTAAKSQLVGGHSFLKGTYAEVGVDGNGGFEGAPWTSWAPPVAGMHYRSGNPYFGFVANPQMNGWATFDGDFFTPGTPENGWGLEIGNTATITPSNNCSPSWPSYTNDITGSITNWQQVGTCIITDWEGSYVSGGYNIGVKITYQLKTGDLFYTTTVELTNNGAMIPEMYYYRNVDPDNNQSNPSGGEFPTTNTIVSQPTPTCPKAHVSATSNLPWFSYMGFAAVGQNFRVSRGGFSNRIGSYIWNATGGLTGTGSAYGDEAISLAYRIQNFAPGATEIFKFVVILDDAAATNAINDLFYFTYTGSLSGPPPACIPDVDTAQTCNGSPVTLTLNGTGSSAGSFTWNWTPPAGLSTTTGTTVNASPTTTTTYTVTGTSASGCFAPIQQKIVVEVVPGPEATYVDPGPQCGTFNLSSLVIDDANNVPGAITHFYTVPPATLADVGSNIFSGTTITPSSPTIYLVYYDPVLGCIDYVPVNITWASATVTVPPASRCASGPGVTLTASGASTYTWSPATGLSATTGSSVVATPAATTTYTVTGNSSGCTGTTTVTVTVNPDPVVSVASATKCASDPAVTLTASGASTYTWSPATGLSATTGTSVTANPAATTTYTITGTSAAGCTGTTTATVTVNPNPVVSVASATKCASDPAVTLTASGASTYTWSPATGLSGTTGTSVSANPAATTTYTITGTTTGCNGTTTATVTVNPNPVIAVNSATICAGTSTTLTATGATSYTWSPATGLSATTGTSVTANPTATTTYTITGTTAGCNGTGTSTVTVNPNPVISVNSPSVCLGEGTTLTASGATSYTWSPATGLSSTTGSSVTATVPGTTTYTVTGTTAGCTGTATSTVTISPDFDATITPAGPFCMDAGAVTLTAADPGGTWSSTCGTCISASGVFTPSLATSGSNDVTYTIPGACGDTSTITIVANPVPDVTATPASETICSGQTTGIALSSTVPSTNFAWTVSATNVSGSSNGTGASIAQMLSTVSPPSGTAVYTVTPTTTAGCVGAPVNVNINVEQQVINNITVTPALCFGSTDGTITIDAPGATSYSIDGINFQPSNVFTVGAGTYTITAENANGCQATAPATITEPTQLFAPTSSTPETCFGSCNGIAGTAPTGGTSPYSYVWTVPGSGSVPFLSGLCSGTYTVDVTDDNGCTVSSSITLAPPPQVLITGNTPVQPLCNGGNDGSLTITASATATQYSINNGVTFQPSNSFTGLTAGTYNVVVADAAGCPATTTITIGEPTALVPVSGADANICLGQSTAISASATGGTGPYNYSWDHGLGAGSTHTVNPGATTTYNVTITDNNGCGPVTESVTVNVNAPLSVETSPNWNICPGDIASISAIASGGGAPYTYTWTNNIDGSTLVAQGGDVSPAVSAIYTVTVTDACGTPSASDTMQVNIFALPAMSFTADTTKGCSPVVVNFEDLTSNISTCTWDFGDGTTATACNTQHIFTDPGCYDINLTVVTNDGCVMNTTTTNMICVYAIPVAEFTFEPQPTDVFDPEVNFTNLTLGGDTYAWDFDGLGNSTETNPSFIFPADSGGHYQVCLSTVTQYGCADSACHIVEIQDQFLLYVPNAFTPDGDGMNEIFMPRIQGEDPLSYEFFIFNRWGEVIFQSNNTQVGWDGTHNGVKAKEDVYVWKVKVKKKINQDKKEFNGSVTLLR